MIRRLDHLNIVVTDLERSGHFFSLLGFKETIRSELDPTFLEQVTGIAGAAGRFIGMRQQGSDLAIELLQFDTPSQPAADIGMASAIGLRHLAFEVDDIDVIVNRLSSAGVHFVSPVQTWAKTGKRLVYFYGPDGILLELAEYPPTS